MAIRFEESSHLYFNDKGYIVPSVTEIISAVYGTGLENAPSFYVERAAAKGTAIHKEIDAWLKKSKQGQTPEFTTWQNWFIQGSLVETWESEILVHAKTDAGEFAGTADFLFKGFLYDWKTCKTATRYQVSKWQKQLSFYAYALRQMGHVVNEPLKIAHITDHVEVINVDYLGDDFVLETMKMYAEGRTAKPETITTQLQTIAQGELEYIQYALAQVAAFERTLEPLREKIKAEMEQRGILSVNVGDVNISYVAPSTRKSFDSTRFKKEHADLFAAYQKESAVKSSVRITLN